MDARTTELLNKLEQLEAFAAARPMLSAEEAATLDERIAYLRSATLAEVERRVRPPASTSRPIASAGVCPNCSNPLVGARGAFCPHCGAATSRDCPLCGTPSPLWTVHCAGCGERLGELMPGLCLDRARRWRELFREIGWWPKRNEELLAVTQLLGVDTQQIDAPGDYWVFCCPIDKGKHRLEKVVVSHEELKPSPGRYVLATRSRLAVIDAAGGRFRDFPYLQLTDMRFLERGGGLFFAGELVTLKVRLAGPSLMDRIDFLMFVAPERHDEVMHYNWQRRMSERNMANAGIIAALGAFFGEAKSGEQ